MADFHTIRMAKPSDYTEIMKLYAELDSKNAEADLQYLRARLCELLAFNGVHIFVCATNNALLSTCTLVILPNLTRAGRPYALIENVVTAPAARRNGLARKTLQSAIDKAWNEGCYMVMLLSGKANENAHKLYDEMGFTRDKTGFQLRR